MRIGIITIDGGTNYGGALQCYAFQEELKSLGHQVEIIRGTGKERIPLLLRLQSLFFSFTWKKIWNHLKRKAVVYLPDEIEEMSETFSKFRAKYYQASEHLPYSEWGEYTNRKFDVIIIGSDQVWTNLYDPVDVAFVGWEPEFKGIRLSFASCSAFDKIRDPFKKRRLTHLLSKFSEVTVRDDATASLVRKITGSTPKIVPDPSELYHYKEFVTEEKPLVAPYIFVYVLGSEIDGGHKEALRRIKAKYGNLKVVGVKTGNALTGVHAVADVMLSSLAPDQWVNCLSKATVVYTDSFHAVLFSIKFGVPFVGYYHKGIRASRLLYLKNRYNAPNIINKATEISEITAYKDCSDISVLRDFLERNGVK